MNKTGNTVDLAQVNLQLLAEFGGKNASLGEMMNHLTALGVRVPCGFATTAQSFRDFLEQGNMGERIYALLDSLDVDDVNTLAKTGKEIRDLILTTPFIPSFEEDVRASYIHLAERIGHDNFSVAVRSSATAEDLPDASFAGQQETFLNVKGIEAILLAIKKVYASLFTDRAIAYRVHNHFSHREVALSVGIQQMVRSDLAVSGVMFTIDTESGFDKVIFITSSYGLGEMVVQGAVNPDEFYVFKPALLKGKQAVVRKTIGSKAKKMIYTDSNDAKDKSVKIVDVPDADQNKYSLTNQEAEFLAKQAQIIENHYQRPMDIEWGKDGISGEFYILQARPETVKSHSSKRILERYQIKSKGLRVLCEGRSIGQRIGQGRARVIHDVSEINKVLPGDVLISDMTDPDWEPVMKRASAIVTNRGGRTCHAAIIARELGIPAVVGCKNATRMIADGDEITVSCAEGDTGFVYQGMVPFDRTELDVEALPQLPVKVMLNVGNPDRAFAFQDIPNMGVGLARLEFLISNTIGIHPKALLGLDALTDEKIAQTIRQKIAAYPSAVEYYIQRLTEGIATIACAFASKPVIVRLSDFKSNEYRNLIGGTLFEPEEENPMLGFRGASRYISPDFSDCFALECEAVKRVRMDMGLTNVEIMIPFVRTINEAKKVIEILKNNGLERGKDGLRIIMMCELPTNALLAKSYLQYFDGFSIGSNDLTQLTLGLDRDSGIVASDFDERDEAVKQLMHLAISECRLQGKYIGICGQGPSDHPDFAEWLMKEGIESISLNPDSVIETSIFLSQHKGNPS